MDDDLNTADAIASIFDLVRAANTAAAAEGISDDILLKARETIIELCEILGLEPAKIEEQAIPNEIFTLVNARSQAKEARDFTTADALRDEIEAKGYRVEDTPQGARILPIE